MSAPEAEPLPAWERQPREPTRFYAGFRLYRDQPPAQRDIAAVAEQLGVSVRRAREWAIAWDWRDRADAWDDECHRIEDRERLEAIRSMHSIHRRAGRVATGKALQALSQFPPAEIPISAISRLLELGTRLERSTLTVSVEELQGVAADGAEVEDPWERIARELDPNNATAVE